MSRLGTALRLLAGGGVALLAGFVPSEVIAWLRDGGRTPVDRAPADDSREHAANGDRQRAVDALLDALDRLNEADVQALKALWDDQPADVRQRAWRKARSIIGRRGLDDSLYWARESITAWAGAAGSGFSGIEGLLGRPGDQVGGRQAALPAVLDAVAAILAGDALSADEEEALSTPWTVATGR